VTTTKAPMIAKPTAPTTNTTTIKTPPSNVDGTPTWTSKPGQLHHTERIVRPNDTTYSQLANWVTRGDSRVTVVRIRKIENPGLFAAYESNRVDAQKRLGRQGGDPCYVEQWLWLGTKPQAMNSILTNGWDSTHARGGKNAFYGLGTYFAPDPKFAHYFVGQRRRNQTAIKTLILARVLTGKMCSKPQICMASCSDAQWETVTSMQKHRQAPAGFESVYNDPMKNQKDGLGTEVISYGKQWAFPAYVFEIIAPLWAEADPYKNRKGFLQIFSTVNTSPFKTCPEMNNLAGGPNTGTACPK